MRYFPKTQCCSYRNYFRMQRGHGKWITILHPMRVDISEIQTLSIFFSHPLCLFYFVIKYCKEQVVISNFIQNQASQSCVFFGRDHAHSYVYSYSRNGSLQLQQLIEYFWFSLFPVWLWTVHLSSDICKFLLNVYIFILVLIRLQWKNCNFVAKIWKNW